MVKNTKVDNIAPIPNMYKSFCFIFSSPIFPEKTPAQNRIVKGLDKVNTSVFQKTLCVVCFERKSKLGMRVIPQKLMILLKPNTRRTAAPM